MSMRKTDETPAIENVPCASVPKRQPSTLSGAALRAWVGYFSLFSGQDLL